MSKESMSDTQAVKQWHQFMDAKTPVVVREKLPNEEGVPGDQFVVVPASRRSFWLGGFSTRDAAMQFCAQNGLAELQAT